MAKGLEIMRGPIRRVSVAVKHACVKRAKAKVLPKKIKELEAEYAERWNARQSHLERLQQQGLKTEEEVRGSHSWQRAQEFSEGIAETERNLNRAKKKLAAARK